MYDVNQAGNPSMVTGFPTEVRRNHAVDPGPAASPSARWLFATAGGEAVTSAWVSTPGAGPEGRTGFHRHTVTTAKTSGVGGPLYRSLAGDIAGVATGDTSRTISVWVRFSVATTATLTVDVRNVASATTYGAATASASVPANTWTRLSAIVYVTAAFDGVQAKVTTAVTPVFGVGATYDLSSVLVEQGEALLPYFDHLYSPDPDLTGSNVGAVNASATILSATRVTNWGILAWRSGQWSAVGTTSLRIDAGSSSITGTVSSPALITARYAGQTATLAGVSKTSTYPGEVLSWPAGLSGALSLQAGYWDALGLGVETYFDGDTPDDDDWSYAWNGTPHNSTTTRVATPGLYVTPVIEPDAVPRSEITVTGLDTLGPTRVTVYRSSEGSPRRKVRGMSSVMLFGSGFGVDYEAPLGRPVLYELVVETGAVIPVRLTTTITLDSATGFIQDPLQPRTFVAMTSDDVEVGDTAVITSKAFRRLTYALESTSVNVLGGREPVAMTGQRMRASGIDFSVLTEAAEQSTALRNLLAQAPIVLVRPLPSWGPLPDVIYTVPAVTEAPVYGEDGVIMTTWTLTGDAVRAPTMNVLVPLWTYDAVEALWVTYNDQQSQATANAYRYLDVQADPTIGG